MFIVYCYYWKKAARVISGSSYRDHCKPLFSQLRILTVTNVHIYSVLTYTRNRLPELQCRNYIHSYSTRFNSHIYIPYHRLSKSLNSYEIIEQKVFNKWPAPNRNLPLNAIKKTLNDCLAVNPFYDLEEFLNFNIVI